MKPNFSQSFGLIRIDRINKFELIEFTGFIRIDSDWPDSFGLKLIPNQSENFRIIPEFVSETKQFHSDLIRRNFSIWINPRLIQNQSELIIPMNPVNQNWSELKIRKNPVNPNQTEFFGIIRIDSDRPDSFGLKVRINSD